MVAKWLRWLQKLARVIHLVAFFPLFEVTSFGIGQHEAVHIL
ncbi:hypothetical protein PEC302107_11630 [Pectobacterium araliae]|nr:hypothetical protein PEC302107_11630 [Pectobacterium carotovorum subsp. carotovorum]